MPCSRRELLSSAVAACIAARLSPAVEQRPNFVIFYTDDQGIGDVGCYGAQDVRTPNLDSLAASGIRFTNWYSNSPVCSPSRAALLTGKYPQRVGIPRVLPSAASFDIPGLSAGMMTLPKLLQKASYRTAMVGKWHLGSAPHSRPNAQGFDEFFGFFSGWTDAYSHVYYRQGSGPSEIFHDLWRNNEEVWENAKYASELFAEKAIEFLKRQTPSRPFFLYVPFGAPHYPMMASQRYLDRFPTTMDRDRRMHAAMVAGVDDAVGLVLLQLENLGLAENTVIFFQSDNGATQEIRADHRARPYNGGSNAPFRGFKAGLFEGGIRMPAILSWQGRIAKGQVVQEIGAAMDILPTFLSMAGLSESIPSDLDGADLAATILSGAVSPHEEVFWSFDGQFAVRRGHWKLILNPPQFVGEPVPGKIWLSNLEEDPSETFNYAFHEPQRVKDLSARIERWHSGWK